MAEVILEINAHPRPPTIIMLGHRSGDRNHALQAGARAYVVKGALPDELLTTLRQEVAR